MLINILYIVLGFALGALITSYLIRVVINYAVGRGLNH